MIQARSKLIQKIIKDMYRYQGSLTEGARVFYEQELALRNLDVAPIEKWTLGDVLGLAKFYGLIKNNDFQIAIYNTMLIFDNKKTNEVSGRIDFLKIKNLEEGLGLYRVVIYPDRKSNTSPVAVITNIAFPNGFFKVHGLNMFVSDKKRVDEIRFSIGSLLTYKQYLESE